MNPIVRMSKAGYITVPKAVRLRHSFQKGDEFVVSERKDD